MSESDKEKSLLRRFKAGEKDAANELIGQYFERVRSAAQTRLAMRGGRVEGPDDIAVSVFESLWERANNNDFDDEDLATTDELWRLLSRMIQFKTEDAARRNSAQKRGRGSVRGESVFEKQDDSNPGIDGNVGTSFTPSEILQLKESYTQLMQRLDDETLQKIAVMRFENYKVSEIASEFGMSERWVKRKLAMIRLSWTDELPNE